MPSRLIILIEIIIGFIAVASIVISILSLNKKDHVENSTITTPEGQTISMRTWIKSPPGISLMNKFIIDNAPPGFIDNLKKIDGNMIVEGKIDIEFEDGKPSLTFYAGNTSSPNGQPYGESCWEGSITNPYDRKCDNNGEDGLNGWQNSANFSDYKSIPLYIGPEVK